MATIKEIVAKAVEVQGAATILENLIADKNLAQDRKDDATTQAAAQQVIVQALIAELKALL